MLLENLAPLDTNCSATLNLHIAPILGKKDSRYGLAHVKSSGVRARRRTRALCVVRANGRVSG